MKNGFCNRAIMSVDLLGLPTVPPQILTRRTVSHSNLKSENQRLHRSVAISNIICFTAFLPPFTPLTFFLISLFLSLSLSISLLHFFYSFSPVLSFDPRFLSHSCLIYFPLSIPPPFFSFYHAFLFYFISPFSQSLFILFSSLFFFFLLLSLSFLISFILTSLSYSSSVLFPFLLLYHLSYFLLQHRFFLIHLLLSLFLSYFYTFPYLFFFIFSLTL